MKINEIKKLLGLGFSEGEHFLAKENGNIF